MRGWGQGLWLAEKGERLLGLGAGWGLGWGVKRCGEGGECPAAGRQGAGLGSSTWSCSAGTLAGGRAGLGGARQGWLMAGGAWAA